MAPFFVIAEVIIYLFEYRKPDIDIFYQIIKADIAFYRKQKGIPMEKRI